jgi:hypothetical protein
LSFAKDALTVAKDGRDEGRHRRVESVETSLKLEVRHAEILWKWVQWEERILKAIAAGDRVIRRGHSPIPILMEASMVGLQPAAFYFTTTRVAFAAVGVPRAKGPAWVNRYLIAFGTSRGAAEIAATCLGRTARRLSPEELYRYAEEHYASVKESVAKMTTVRDRYLHYVSEDLGTLQRRLRSERRAKKEELAKLVELLAAVAEQDRPFVGQSGGGAIVESRPSSEPRVLSTLIAFANQNLTNPTEAETGAWTERLLAVSPYSSSRSGLDSSLRDLQKDIREVLMALAAADRWARTKEYAQLVYTNKWPRNPGLELFNVVPDDGVITLPFSVSLELVRVGNRVGERLVPGSDCRSCLLIALRDELKSLGDAFRLRRCPICGAFFIPIRRRRFCASTCKIRAYELRRKRTGRNNKRLDEHKEARSAVA